MLCLLAATPYSTVESLTLEQELGPSPSSGLVLKSNEPQQQMTFTPLMFAYPSVQTFLTQLLMGTDTSCSPWVLFFSSSFLSLVYSA